MKSYIFLLTIFTILFSSCSKKSREFGTEGQIIISGIIKNFDPKTDAKTIQVVRRDFFDQNTKIASEINKNGEFLLSFTTAYPQQFYIKYGEFANIFGRPGDSLYIEIDRSVLENKKEILDNGEFFVRFSETDLGRANRDFNLFYQQLVTDHNMYFYDDSERKKEAEEFTTYIKRKEEVFLKAYQQYKSDHKTNTLFSEITEDYIKYGTMHDLLRYTWIYPYANGINKDTFALPDNYYAFLNTYNNADNKLFTISHLSFLHELNQYASNYGKEVQQKIQISLIEKKYNAIMPFVMKRLDSITSGFTRELILSQFYMSLIEAQQIEIFEAIYDSTSITNNYFLSKIREGHISLKKYLSNTEFEGANLMSLKSDITSAIIDTISSRYQGKVIYIDFWAPWCSPCMNEMKYSKQIQEHFGDNEDVIFLFLANRCKEDSWKATIANKELSGEHLLLTEDQFNLLAADLNIGGIPHYAIIDKSGHIVNKDAPRPSEKGHLLKEINKLLN